MKGTAGDSHPRTMNGGLTLSTKKPAKSAKSQKTAKSAKPAKKPATARKSTPEEETDESYTTTDAQEVEARANKMVELLADVLHVDEMAMLQQTIQSDNGTFSGKLLKAVHRMKTSS